MRIAKREIGAKKGKKLFWEKGKKCVWALRFMFFVLLACVTTSVIVERTSSLPCIVFNQVLPTVHKLANNPGFAFGWWFHTLAVYWN